MSLGTRVKDYSPRRGDAFRIGAQMQSAEAFTVGVVNCDAAAVVEHEAVEHTALLTFLGAPKSRSNGPFFKPGELYQLEAYVVGMLLDAERLKIPLYILTENIPESFIKAYSTEFIKFIEFEGIKYKEPDSCNHPQPEVLKRFFAYHFLLSTGYFDKYKYLVHLDLRDSRIVNIPEWSPDYDLWLQGIKLKTDVVCGGFQAGTLKAMKALMHSMYEGSAQTKCINDQSLLNKLFTEGKLGVDRSRVTLNGNIINSQHTRVFRPVNAFVHGNWMMTAKWPQQKVKPAYIHGVPFLGE